MLTTPYCSQLCYMNNRFPCNSPSKKFIAIYNTLMLSVSLFSSSTTASCAKKKRTREEYCKNTITACNKLK